MMRNIPEKLILFLENGIKDAGDGYDYASQLNSILSTKDCQSSLNSREIEALRDYANRIKKVGEINPYSKEHIINIEKEIFGLRGILGYLNSHKNPKTLWPF